MGVKKKDKRTGEKINLSFCNVKGYQQRARSMGPMVKARGWDSQLFSNKIIAYSLIKLDGFLKSRYSGENRCPEPS